MRRRTRRRSKAAATVKRTNDVPEQRASEPSIGEFDGRTALVLDGAVQSVQVVGGGEPAGYWPALVPRERPRRTLVLGLGGGTVVRLLQRGFPGEPALEIVGVDADARVLTAARRHFAIDRLGIDMVEGDALDYLRWCRERRACFDLVIVDLFRDGDIPDFVCSRRFLGAVAAVLTPAGLLSINLNRGEGHERQLRRLGRRFLPERVVATGMNLVVHARAGAPRHYRRR